MYAAYPMVRKLLPLFLFLFMSCVNEKQDNSLLYFLLGYFKSPPLYKDMRNGTVYVYHQKLYWAKCLQEPLPSSRSTYHFAKEDCSGQLPGTFQYCASNNDLCNSPATTGDLIKSTSSAFDSCNGLTLGGMKWRVPTTVELADFVYNVHIHSPETFPFHGAVDLWSSTSNTAANAWQVEFFPPDGLEIGVYGSTNPKDTYAHLRCVSDG